MSMLPPNRWRAQSTASRSEWLLLTSVWKFTTLEIGTETAPTWKPPKPKPKSQPPTRVSVWDSERGMCEWEFAYQLRDDRIFTSWRTSGIESTDSIALKAGPSRSWASTSCAQSSNFAL